jgi:hypothetical protein
VTHVYKAKLLGNAANCQFSAVSGITKTKICGPHKMAASLLTSKRAAVLEAVLVQDKSK